MPMSNVKDLMIEKAPNTTRLADKMLAKNLIERKGSSTDRRVVYVRISNVGNTLLKKIDKKKSEIQVALFERITEKEAILMSQILDKFRG